MLGINIQQPDNWKLNRLRPWTACKDSFLSVAQTTTTLVDMSRFLYRGRASVDSLLIDICSSSSGELRV